MQLKSGTGSKILKVGITGGIGSGKTIVSRIFNNLGIPVYNADDRAKWIVANDEKVREGLVSLFGPEAFVEGKINRTFISSNVFSNQEKLNQLNHLVHPRVGEDYMNWMNSVREAPYVLKEAALLYEANSYKDLDRVITVYAPLALRMERLLKRDTHRTEQDIRKIIDNQLSDEEKVKRADYVIYNDHEHMLIPQALKIDQLLRKEAGL